MYCMSNVQFEMCMWWLKTKKKLFFIFIFIDTVLDTVHVYKNKKNKKIITIYYLLFIYTYYYYRGIFKILLC